MQVNNVANYLNNHVAKNVAPEETQLSDVENRSALTEEPAESSEIDWDDEQLVRTRFFKTVLDERRQRQQEREELWIERQQLAHLRQNLDREKTELQAKEAKLAECLRFSE